MFHHWLQIWFQWVELWGYWGIFILMSLESSIVPIPSEMIIPPAAFWASQGKLSFSGVILVGALGSYFGSLVNYLFARWLGVSIIEKYGKYVLISQSLFHLATRCVERFGAFGIFLARLLPVLRHFVSIPIGILKMPFISFSVATVLGSTAWCLILAQLGVKVIGDSPLLLNSPEGLILVMKKNLFWVVGLVFGVIFLYVLGVYLQKRLFEESASGKS